jgi:flagellar capping protein FliD
VTVNYNDATKKLTLDSSASETILITADSYALGFEAGDSNRLNRSLGGENAEIQVNGKIVSNSTNTFTINGTKIEVLAEHLNSTEPIVIKMSSDPDELIDKLKDFIEDYNALITTLNSMVKEKPNKDYSPLSGEQKAELTTDEIEMWETEAKKGILYQDDTINSILSDMREILYKGVGETGIALFNIGITTVSILTSPERNGHLEITPTNEDKLRTAIIENPDGVRELFAHSTEGVAVRLNNIIDRAINTSSDPEKRGSLVNIAGTDVLTGDNTSTLDRKIEDHDENIATLKTRLEAEYERYWNQFAALEKAISNMNSQSSWLTDFVSQ